LPKLGHNKEVGTCPSCGGEVWVLEHYVENPVDNRIIRKQKCMDCKKVFRKEIWEPREV